MKLGTWLLTIKCRSSDGLTNVLLNEKCFNSQRFYTQDAVKPLSKRAFAA